MTETLLQKAKRKEWLPQKVAILGAGRSGIAVAKFLDDRGIEIYISESCGQEKLDFLLASNGLADKPHESEGHSEALLSFELIICSPGIPWDIPILKKARKRGVPVWSEIELAYRHSKAPFIAVTGSTGKSTTISLIGAILEVARIPSIVAGNIGLPLIGVVPNIPKEGLIAAEISSFQLETIDQFKPKYASVINLLKNHLDRYPDEDAYYQAKKDIVKNMATGDYLIVNARDPKLMQWVQSIDMPFSIIYFGDSVKGQDCVWFEDGNVVLRFEGDYKKVLKTDDMCIKGLHNIENACAAVAMTYPAGIDIDTIAQGICSFKGLAHRLEFVKEVNGVHYYNDSKATTAESIKSAIEAFDVPVHLIAGGKDKGCQFSLVNDVVEEHVTSVVVIGEAANRIAKEWDSLTTILRADSLPEAVDVLYRNAHNGDVVLLSPGCSSFDMFSSFEERGDVFKATVNELDEVSHD